MKTYFLRQVAIFFFLKYILFYVFLMLKNKNYQLIRTDSFTSWQDWFYYLFLILFLPTIELILFYPFIHWLLKVKNKITFWVTLIPFLAVEYLFYTYLASSSNWENGIYNSLFSVVAFFVLQYNVNQQKAS